VNGAICRDVPREGNRQWAGILAVSHVPLCLESNRLHQFRKLDCSVNVGPQIGGHQVKKLYGALLAATLLNIGSLAPALADDDKTMGILKGTALRNRGL
jgi:hypothetical protein